MKTHGELGYIIFHLQCINRLDRMKVIKGNNWANVILLC